MRGGIFSPRAAFGGTEFPTNVFAGVNVFLDKRLVVDTVTRRTRVGKMVRCCRSTSLLSSITLCALQQHAPEGNPALHDAQLITECCVQVAQNAESGMS